MDNERNLKGCFRIVVEERADNEETGDDTKKKYLIDILQTTNDVCLGDEEKSK